MPLFVASTGTSFHVEGCLEIGGVLTLFDRIGKPVIVVGLLRAHVPERTARYADIPVLHGEGIPGVADALRVGDAHPSGEVPAVEKFGPRFAAARTRCQRKGQRRKKKSHSHRHRIVFGG